MFYQQAALRHQYITYVCIFSHANIIYALQSINLRSLLTFELLLKCYLRTLFYRLCSDTVSCAVICLLLTGDYSFNCKDYTLFSHEFA